MFTAVWDLQCIYVSLRCSKAWNTYLSKLLNHPSCSEGVLYTSLFVAVLLYCTSVITFICRDLEEFSALFSLRTQLYTTTFFDNILTPSHCLEYTHKNRQKWFSYVLDYVPNSLQELLCFGFVNYITQLKHFTQKV